MIKEFFIFAVRIGLEKFRKSCFYEKEFAVGMCMRMVDG